jgi:hypothetical protein
MAAPNATVAASGAAADKHSTPAQLDEKQETGIVPQQQQLISQQLSYMIGSGADDSSTSAGVGSGGRADGLCESGGGVLSSSSSACVNSGGGMMADPNRPGHVYAGSTSGSGEDQRHKVPRLDAEFPLFQRPRRFVGNASMKAWKLQQRRARVQQPAPAQSIGQDLIEVESPISPLSPPPPPPPLPLQSEERALPHHLNNARHVNEIYEASLQFVAAAAAASSGYPSSVSRNAEAVNASSNVGNYVGSSSQPPAILPFAERSYAKSLAKSYLDNIAKRTYEASEYGVNDPASGEASSEHSSDDGSSHSNITPRSMDAKEQDTIVPPVAVLPLSPHRPYRAKHMSSDRRRATRSSPVSVLPTHHAPLVVRNSRNSSSHDIVDLIDLLQCAPGPVSASASTSAPAPAPAPVPVPVPAPAPAARYPSISDQLNENAAMALASKDTRHARSKLSNHRHSASPLPSSRHRRASSSASSLSGRVRNHQQDLRAYFDEINEERKKFGLAAPTEYLKYSASKRGSKSTGQTRTMSQSASQSSLYAHSRGKSSRRSHSRRHSSSNMENSDYHNKHYDVVPPLRYRTQHMDESSYTTPENLSSSHRIARGSPGHGSDRTRRNSRSYSSTTSNSHSSSHSNGSGSGSDKSSKKRSAGSRSSKRSHRKSASSSLSSSRRSSRSHNRHSSHSSRHHRDKSKDPVGRPHGHRQRTRTSSKHSAEQRVSRRRRDQSKHEHSHRRSSSVKVEMI